MKRFFAMLIATLLITLPGCGSQTQGDDLPALGSVQPAVSAYADTLLDASLSALGVSAYEVTLKSSSMRPTDAAHWVVEYHITDTGTGGALTYGYAIEATPDGSCRLLAEGTDVTADVLLTEAPAA